MSNELEITNKIKVLQDLAAKYRHHAEMSGAGSTRDHFLEEVSKIEQQIQLLSGS